MLVRGKFALVGPPIRLCAECGSSGSPMSNHDIVVPVLAGAAGWGNSAIGQTGHKSGSSGLIEMANGRIVPHAALRRGSGPARPATPTATPLYPNHMNP